MVFLPLTRRKLYLKFPFEIARTVNWTRSCEEIALSTFYSLCANGHHGTRDLRILPSNNPFHFLRILEEEKPKHFRAKAREKCWVFRAFNRDVKGKLGNLLHKNIKIPSTFWISDLEETKKLFEMRFLFLSPWYLERRVLVRFCGPGNQWFSLEKYLALRRFEKS